MPCGYSWLKQCHSWLLSRRYVRRGSVRHVRCPHLHRFESSITRHCGIHTGWRRLIGSRKLQIIFHKRATKYRSLLRKMTYKDKGSYESLPPCSIWLIRVFMTQFLYDMTHSWLPLYVMTPNVHSCIHETSCTCHSWLILYNHGSIYAWTWLVHDSCHTSWLKLYIHVLMALVVDVIRDSYCMFVARFMREYDQSVREYDSSMTHVIHHDSNDTLMYSWL